MSESSAPEDRGFLSRWSRRKLQTGTDSVPAAEPVSPAPDKDEELAAVSEPIAAPADDQSPPPTLDELQALDHTADLTRFIAKDVDEGVRRAALCKLFADPQFNVMDGLDTYIDDYNTPSPVPPGLLARLRLTPNLGLDLADPVLTTPAAQRQAFECPGSTSENRTPTTANEADTTDQPDSSPTPDMPQDASLNATPPTP
jgi:hypothetical protein